MTRDEILAREPGIKLDILVAIHVMRWETRKYYVSDDSYHEHYIRNGEKYENVNYPDHWQPSKYIDSAWEVVEKFETIEVQRFITDKGLWFCEIKNKVWHRSYGKSAPEAICKAALLAVMGQEAS